MISLKFFKWWRMASGCPANRKPIPWRQVREWLMPIWGPDMAYCPGCCQAKPKKDMVFFFRRSPKGVCKDCSENFDFEDAGRTACA